MTTFKKRLLIASAAAALLVGTSMSAMAWGGGGDRCDGARGGPSGPNAEKMSQRMGERMAKRQAEMKEKLKLTPAQESAWTAYTSTMQPPASPIAQRPDPADMAKLTTPQRMEKMQALKTERDAQMAKRLDATKTFYATLTPEQQKVFDELTLPGRGNRHPGGHRHGGPGMNG